MSTTYSRKRKYASGPSLGVKKARLGYGSRTAMYGLGRGRFGAGGRPTMNVTVAVRGEKKGVDFDLDNSDIVATTNTNAQAIVLNLVQQGAGSWNRVGRKICLKSVRLRGTLVQTLAPLVTTSELQENVCRMVVVWDKQPSGAAIPAFDTIFGRTAQDGTESCQFLDPPRFDNMDRFQVLHDSVFTFNPDVFNNAGGSADAVTKVIDFDKYIKLGGREVTFSGQSTPMTIADISTGALYVYFRAKNYTNGYNEMAIENGMARLRYTD